MIDLAVAIKNNYNAEEIEILKLAKAYEEQLRHHKKLNFKTSPFIGDEDPRTSKYWRAFEQFNKICQAIPAINKEKYIEAQIYFSKDIKAALKPGWLCTKKAIARYVDYITNIKKIPDNLHVKDVRYEKKCLESLKSTILFLTKLKHELNKDSVFEVLSFKQEHNVMPTSFVHILSGDISLPFLAASRSYAKFYYSLEGDVKHEFPTINSLVNLRMYIANSKKLHKFCREFLKEDYVN